VVGVCGSLDGEGDYSQVGLRYWEDYIDIRILEYRC
jgi:hypothetical protein